MPQGLRESVKGLVDESNIGVPGVLLFRVDRRKYISYYNPCAKDGTVLSSPKLLIIPQRQLFYGI